VDNVVKEFVRLFEEITGNEFERSWEREKKFQKQPLKFYPTDMVHIYFFLYLMIYHSYFWLLNIYIIITLNRMIELKLDMGH